jgi:hypothetical protein
MPSWIKTLLLSFVVAIAQAADPTCSTGIKSPNNPICCPSYCQTCDMGDCASKPGGKMIIVLFQNQFYRIINI